MKKTNEEQPKRVNLHNKKSGRVVLIGFKAASALAEKYPNEFEIVNDDKLQAINSTTLNKEG